MLTSGYISLWVCGGRAGIAIQMPGGSRTHILNILVAITQL